MIQWFSQLTRSVYFELAGWSLIYSLWFGLIIALIVFFILKSTKGYLSSNVRYIITLLGQLAIVVLTTITFINAMPYGAGVSTGTSQIFLLFKDQTGFDLSNNISVLESFRNFMKDYIPFFMIFWLGGFAFYLIRILGGLVYLGRVRNSAEKVGTEFTQHARDLAERLGVSRAFRLTQSSLLKTPVAIGHFKPLIIFPVGMIADLTINEIKGVLAHELAHIKRNDYLINIVQSIIEAIYFFNPSVWWISAMIREERELACDDMALSCLGSRRCYAEALAKINERDYQGKHMLSPGISGHENNSLVERIKRITNNEMKSKPVDWLPALVLTAILLIPILLLARESRENMEPENSVIAGVVSDLTFDQVPELRELAPVISDTVPEKTLKRIPEPWDVDVDVNLDKDLQVPVITDIDLDINIDPVPVIEVPVDLDLDLDFDMAFEIDLDMLPDFDMGRITLPSFVYPNDTFPHNWNEKEWETMSKQWQLEMQHIREEMARFQQEFNQNMKFNLQEWETTHRNEMEELRRRVQEEMGTLEMEEFHAQQERLLQEFNQGNWQKEFQEQMKDFEHQMKEFQFQMKSIPDMQDNFREMEEIAREEMARMEDFEMDVRKQLVEDGYIKKEEEVTIEFRKDDLLINDEKVRDKDYPKYNEIRKKYFHDEKGEIKFRIN